MNHQQLVKYIAQTFQAEVQVHLKNRLHSFYVVGGYAFGKISKQRPDVNFLLIFDKFTTPEDYLEIGEICKTVEEKYKKDATVKIEFRPFRYIKPRYRNDFEVSINPIIISTGEIKQMNGVIFNKWFTNGLKKSNKLVFGNDFLKSLKIQNITKDDLMKGIVFDVTFFTLPLSRAPAQYDDTEYNLLLNESLINAKNVIYFGIVVAMTADELKNKVYVSHIENKEKIPSFYEDRYGKEAGDMVKLVFEVRENYLNYKDDVKTAKEIFSVALNIGSIVRNKFLH